ncbi:MAG: outer membrane beta-barrel protein, partial [Candidatus Altiarchaeota archaeon]|nr:outer membrane beta-barrel protein [Candidatus Altiarchaeota archaeon]
SLILSFSDNPEYMYYHKEKSRGGFGNSFSPGIRMLLLGRFALSGSYEYQKHFRQISREVNFLTENTSEGYHADFFFETARLSSLGISADIRNYSHENLDLEGSSSSLARQLNREERSLHGELYYSLSPVRSFFLRAGYTEYSFESAEAGWRDSTSWQASGGIRFSATGRINGLLSLGYKELHPKEGGRRSFSGIFGNTELSMRLGRITLRTVYSRDPMFSYLSDVYYYVDHRFGGGLSFYLNRLLRLDYNYYHELMDYPEPVPYQDVGGMRYIDRKDRGDLHSAGITIRLFRNLGLGISANFADRRSNFPHFSYERFFVGGSLTYDF